jgi:hypothetical protein
MAKKVTKAQTPAPVASTPAQVPVVAVKAEKKVKVVETAETKWARRLKRWEGKAQAQGVDVRKLYTEAMSA